ncbi:helix-turn-helix domain-containing protein [Streptomyces sp. 7N604]|uniref:helix-turn-helix domain-containing protein n=1 Tax=Streptomyces sp. 7N604 TaxID=3457415 RepID=UPI003FD62BB9
MKELREVTGLTLSEVAEQLEVNQGSLSRIENGERGTTPVLARALLDCYGVDDAAVATASSISSGPTRSSRSPGGGSTRLSSRLPGTTTISLWRLARSPCPATSRCSCQVFRRPRTTLALSSPGCGWT